MVSLDLAFRDTTNFARAKKIAGILNSYSDEIGNITPVIKSEITEMLDSGVVFKIKNKVKDKVKLIEEEEDARAKKIADVLNSYFDEIGNITPVIKSEITEMLDSGVPPEWFELAFRECAANDVRTWAYARAIIVRWLSDGKVSDNRANGSGKRKRRDTTNSGNDIEAFRALVREQQEQRKELV